MIEDLFDCGAVKFGTFQLKSGIESPIYFDLRVIVSYPKLLIRVADALWEKVKPLPFDLICGVPYTALPIATVMSTKHSIPMVMRRKEVKTYGTKRAIEGVYNQGQNCLIVEDLITSGGSVLETVEPIKHEGLLVTDCALLIDREQGGKERLEQEGITVHSIFTITDLLDELTAKQKISANQADEVKDFLGAKL